MQSYFASKCPEAAFAAQIHRPPAIQNHKGASCIITLELERGVYLAKLVRKRLAQTMQLVDRHAPLQNPPLISGLEGVYALSQPIGHKPAILLNFRARCQSTAWTYSQHQAVPLANLSSRHPELHVHIPAQSRTESRV